MSSRKIKLASLLEAVPDALVGMDQSGVIRFVNRQAESLFGYDRDQLIGQPIQRLVPEPLWQIYIEHRENYFADPRARSAGLDVELPGRHRDGTEFPVNISLSHIDTGDVLLVITAVRDVIRQKQAIRNAQLIEAIVTYSGEAITSTTLAGIITSWNPAAEKMFGYSRHEMVGTSAKVLVPGDRADQADAVIARVSAGEAVQELETTAIAKNGTLFPVSLAASPIRGEDGSVVGASVICRDVSELKRAAQYARGLIEADPDPLGMVSPQGTVIDVNQATVEATGVPRDELIGSDFSQYFTDPELARAGVQQAFTHGSLTDGVLTVRHRDGTQTDYLCNAVVHRDLDGGVLGVLTSARDMTKHKEGFEAAQRIAAIVHSSDEAIFANTLGGIITSWNPACERLFGYSGAEIIGQSIELLCPKDRIGELRANMAKIRAGVPVEQLETLRVRKDGTAFPICLTVSPIRDIGSAVVGAAVICHDVSAHRQALMVAQRLARIVQDAGDAIISGSLDGIVTSWNPAAEKIFGYSSTEMVGQHLDILVPASRSGEMTSILSTVGAGRGVQNVETTRIRKDGTEFPVVLSVSPICEQDGAVVGVCVICRDVSELERAAAYARSLMEASLDPLVTISTDGTITDINQAAVTATGVARNTLMGTELFGYFTDPDKARQGVSRVIADGAVTHYVLTLRHRNGTLTDLACTVSLYRDTGGRVLGVLVAARDLTVQKHG